MTCTIVGTLLHSGHYTSLRQAFFRVLRSVAFSDQRTNQITLTGFERERKEQNTPEKLYNRFIVFAKSPHCQAEILHDFICERQTYYQTTKVDAG